MVLALTAFCGHTQSIDTSKTAVPNTDLRRVLKGAEEGRLKAEELSLERLTSTLLRQQLSVQQSVLTQYQRDSASLSLRIRTLVQDQQLSALQDSLSGALIHTLETDLSRQRKRAWLLTVLAVTGALLAAFK